MVFLEFVFCVVLIVVAVLALAGMAGGYIASRIRAFDKIPDAVAIVAAILIPLIAIGLAICFG